MLWNLNLAVMSTIRNFEEMEIWQLARELLCHIYDDFRDCKDFVFKNQVCSDGEVKSMYYVAEDQSYVSAGTAKDRRYQTDIIRTKITNFMLYLKSRA
jgi:hypothetical protein